MNSAPLQRVLRDRSRFGISLLAAVVLAAIGGAAELEAQSEGNPVVGETAPPEGAEASPEEPVHFVEAITVTSASRYRERAFDAPAAVTVLDADEVERQAPGAQMPKLLEQTPAVELTQSGLYDFNVNLRGFNGPLSRRIAVLIDGRDPSIPFLGAQEWATLALPLDDVESLEVVRGPSAALYGPNASSGVVHLVTRPPQASAGGMARLTAGELETVHVDLRWAGELGGAWWKLLGGVRSSQTFAVSRRGQAEYSVPCTPGRSAQCLPQEAVDPAPEVEGWAGSARLDKDFGDRLALTVEAGDSSAEGATVLSNLGRITFADSRRPWARARLTGSRLEGPRWSVQATASRRDAPLQTNLSSGGNFALDSETWTVEAQGDRDLGPRLRLVLGGFFRDQKIDTFDPATGAQTLVFEPVTDRARAAYGQLEWLPAASWKLVLAGRWDDSETFYDQEFSPRASVVWSPSSRHTLRLSFNEAFQAANYAEALAQADVTAGLPLQTLEEVCTPFGVDCGFGGAPTRVLAVGNPDVGVERVQAFELGYRALVGDSAFLTVDVYRSDNENFITDLLPELGTPLGRINHFFGPYQPPAALPASAREGLTAALEAALGPLAPLLSHNLDGDPFVTLLTYGSFGEVRSQGVELAGRWSPGRRWTVSASASLFDFDLRRSLPGLDQVLSPNAPKHQARAAVAYVGDRLSVDLSGRWVDGFFWSSGVFTGEIPSYSTVDLAANLRWNDRLSLGVHVSNVFDQRHHEAFGGDRIGRRALGSLAVRW